jgi:hypothetical protein
VAATSREPGWTQVWNGKHSGGTGSRTDDTWHQTLLPNGKLETTAATSTLKNYANDSSSYESTGTYSAVNAVMMIGGTTSESGSSGTSSSSTTRSELVNGAWVTTNGDGTTAAWDGGKGSSIGSGGYSYEANGGGVAGRIDESGTWKWGSRYDTFSDLVDGAWATSGFGGDESSVASHFSAKGDGTFQITLPGSASGSGGTGVSADTLVIEGKIKESSEENFSRDEAAAFVFAAPVSGVSQPWQQVGGGVNVKGNSSVTWDAWNEPPSGESGVSFLTGQSSGLDYDLWSNFDGDGWTDGGTATITNDFSANTTVRRQGTYAIEGLKGAVITGGVTTDASADRTSSYEVIRTLSSDGTWRVTSGTGSSHQEESATTKYGDGTGTVVGSDWDTATETLKNSKPLTKRVWFDTTSTIDTATGTWTTTGDGGSESSGVVEITFTGERGYTKPFDVTTAMTLVASGTYSQTSKATIDYDYSTESKLATSGVVTTTGTGTASLSDGTRSWWNAETGNTSSASSDGTTVTHTTTVTHSEDGDRNEKAAVTTNWVFAGGGWQEESTKATTDNASKGSFSSGYSDTWQVVFDPVRDGREGPGGGGFLIKTATGSHNYTSSSEMTRTARAGGGCAVTGRREGGGESHGTSSVRYHDQDYDEFVRSATLTANDSFDYTGDAWRIEFGETGMPSITYAGTLTTSESFSTKTIQPAYSGVRTDRHAFSKQDSRTRSANTDEGPSFAVSGGRGLYMNGFYDTSFASFFAGYGNSYDVARAGYGYDESRSMLAAFGAGAPEAAAPSLVPSGSSTVPNGISSEASNYETRLAGLSQPRLVTSGSRPIGAGSANLPTIPAISTPSIGSLGFEKSDSAPEAPTTKPFNTIVVSGMAGPASGQGGGLGASASAFAAGYFRDVAQVYANTEGMSPLWRAYTVGGFAIADMVGVRQLSDAFSTHDAADGHVQSWGERVSDGAFGAIGLAGTTAVVGRAAIAAANKVDDVGRCMNALTKINLGACFTGDTLVQVTALAGAPSTDPESAAAVATATLQTVAIAMLPLGSRVLAGNPRPEEMDDSFAEPEQATWVSVSVRMTKRDGTVVKAEFLRPREWVARHGIKAGAALPMAIAEMEVEGDAVVTAIGPCPQIATGEGRVVTGTFVTREAGNLVRVALENGTEIRATDVHPVWSVDREEWVPAGEFQPGERMDTLGGPVAVREVQRLESPLDVYNIEVHGEHVFRVTADGVLVHNACASTSGNNVFASAGRQAHVAYKAGIADNERTFKEFVIPNTRKRIDFVDLANGIVYELKPNNATAIARGYSQAARYVELLKQLPEYAGINWRTVVDTY